MQKKTILLTGAGGSVGKEALQLLVNKHNLYNIRIFDLDTPKNRKYFETFSDKIEIFYGDITRKEDTVAPVTGVDVIIHLASVIPPLANEKTHLVDSVNVGGTRHLVENTEKYAPDAFMLFASSVATYGDRLQDPYIRVTDPLVPSEGDYYAQGKIIMEKIVRESRLQWSIFRLGAIMGPKNHKISGIMFLMSLDQLMEIATPRDTARAFVNGIDHLQSLNQKIFNLGGGADCVTTYREFLGKNFEIYGLGKLNFPERAFATKNFHCGVYVDGDELEKIVRFRKDTLEDYYQMVREATPMLQRWATRLFAPIIKKYLLSKSEPYKAWKQNDTEKIKRYFQ
ncbi:NAD-dependent epimerase/dehydratase family protein [Capnocytophaga canis]|uniref:NAD(P)-dependent oxidoreductase n=1 Tax=Capnocytophaga canis TaxID=1848903 RepID=A0A0B7I3M7_9FLAO|nr:NAD(P)-dependent oxidoreductase [Capnocytophaga canis]RIY36972.1 NAD(P)-dependent oxidoreductase [Capnocytophaga canis]CEN44702.1 NAD-binding domain 4 [Capnocytophaga canis]